MNIEEYDDEVYELDEYGNPTLKEPPEGWDAYGKSLEISYLSSHIYDPLAKDEYRVEMYNKLLKTKPEEFLGNIELSDEVNEELQKQFQGFLSELKSARSYKTPPSGKDIEELAKWVSGFLGALEEDGHDASKIREAIKTAQSNQMYGQLQGYLYQVKKHYESWKSYKLIEIEPKTMKDKGYRADERQIDKVWVDYKAYSATEKDSKTFEQQLLNYAKASHEWENGSVLLYQFKNVSPEWFKTLMKNTAKSFAPGVKVGCRSDEGGWPVYYIEGSAYKVTSNFFK